MWDFITDLIVIELMERLSKPWRIGCWVVFGLLALALFFMWWADH